MRGQAISLRSARRSATIAARRVTAPGGTCADPPRTVSFTVFPSACTTAVRPWLISQAVSPAPGSGRPERRAARNRRMRLRRRRSLVTAAHPQNRASQPAAAAIAIATIGGASRLRWPGRPSLDAAVSPMPRLGGRAGSVRNDWHYVSMTAVSLGHLWHHLAAWADKQGHPPSHLLILGTGLLAAAVVASRRAWPVARTVVTIAHEGGHALAAVATGRRLHSVRVLHNSAGVTVTAGSPSGPGIILTAL